MTVVTVGAERSAVRQGARRKLFVEGKAGSLDPAAIGAVLGTAIDVAPLGPCFNVLAAAEALHPHHSEYYFLADRDYRRDEEVESLWQNFPNPTTFNFLVWRKHELENYFICPPFISKSQFVRAKKTLGDIEAHVRSEMRKRKWLEASNRYIESLRHEFRVSLKFLAETELTTPSLENCVVLADARLSAIRPKKPSRAQIKAGIKAELDYLAGGKSDLEFGHGTWLEQMPGKEVFRTIVGSVIVPTDREGRALQGVVAQNEFVRDLIRATSQSDWPEDFRALRRALGGK